MYLKRNNDIKRYYLPFKIKQYYNDIDLFID